MHDRRWHGEQGQIVALLAVSLLALLAMCALVMDVGFTWYAKRQMQSQVDAAALAAAQELPDQTKAGTLVAGYLSKNPAPGGVSETPAVVTFGRLQNSRRTAPVNKVTVEESGTIPSIFGRVLGINGFAYDVKGNACSPCGNKKFDIMLVVDRTGSMCDTSSNCSDLNNAKIGIRELMSTMDGKLDEIGMVAFPPVPVTARGACEPVPGTSWSNHYSYGQYDNPSYTFLADPLKNDYQMSDGSLNTTSSLYLHTVQGNDQACIPPGGGTSYSQALQAGLDELNKDGRSDATKIIIFMTDGAANTGPARSCTVGPYVGMAGCTDLPATNFQNTNPCQSAINVATSAKTAGVIIYAIGYGLATSGTDTHCWRALWENSGLNGTTFTPPNPNDPAYNHIAGNGITGAQESPALSPRTTLTTIASSSTQFYDAAAGDVTPVFQAIASDIENGRSHLVDDGS